MDMSTDKKNLVGVRKSLEANPLTTAHQIIANFRVNKFAEFGATGHAFDSIKDSLSVTSENEVSDSLLNQLNKTINVLDISPRMKEKLREIGLHTVHEVMEAPESKPMQAYYVGQGRSCYMRTESLLGRKWV